MKDSSTATERVGRYQLLEPIGGGPNGMVSRAKVFGVAGFERQFAVKRFLAELTAGPAAQALSQAARSYGSLEHPRIARMSEFGVAQGQTFTAVELVAGLDVFRLMQESKLAAVAIPPGGALALVSQAARAVGYAHGRGLSHLGLSPTNVIVTADGDVKVTDFGILAATMPSKPVDTPRLSQRIPYLAPEQLASEATSAATDVFVLGVLAYELVTGQRAYRGDYPAAVAQAILAGPPAEPPLPRPIVRVLQRCLARSPFERFPDARALADALDAALRVAPVPGTRKDIGAQIKTTLERYATLNEGNLSGMVALNLGAQQPEPSARPEARTEPSAIRVVSPPSSPASTMRDMPKPTSTMPGLAPPPIPVPPGVTPPPTNAGLAQPGSSPPSTMLGVAASKKPTGIPSIKPPTSIPSITKPTPPAPPKVGALTQGWDAMPDATGGEVLEPSGLIEVDDSGPVKIPHRPPSEDDEDGTMPFRDPNTMQGMGSPPNAPPSSPAVMSPSRLRPPTPGQTFDSTTGEMSRAMLESLNRKATMSTAELAPQRPSMPEITIEPGTSPSLPPAPPGPHDHEEDAPGDFAADASAVANDIAEQSPSATMPGHAAPPRRDSQPGVSQPSISSPPLAPPAPSNPMVRPLVPEQKSKLPIALLGLLLVGGLGAGGYYLYTTQSAKQEPEVATGSGSAKVVANTVPVDAAVAQPKQIDAAAIAVVATPDAAQTAPTPPDAATQVATAPPDAAAEKPGPDTTNAVKPSGSSDQLQINSNPKGARVFIDGADQGTTPLKLPGSTDRHSLAVVLPGKDLYLAEVDGHGVFDVELKDVEKGPKAFGGIKVLKCKKDRYYVYVDGRATGQMCPTERINVPTGAHAVEIYDLVTESRRKFNIVVKDEGASERIRLE
ncbi:MAG TPA: serine/threonine-protein kinase [Kofleriaceae bacterium]|nr:serine/threonine-protein kinase [Kofleriaceae bacterium]